ncbi:DODA-type extradiol aromatic ring-opening family dioxygenase [Corallococcus terminator]|uniref:Dioxygenase n=1 Tax=Corallococcus terminator TaxID=2316733 RepID=A0A3A8IGF3_9BACT|nr:class III extradiol ring-cleavage dioxygenase [Corallococcus terminator]RKG81718.1 dioxygenase [Corallococcus terminator]
MSPATPAKSSSRLPVAFIPHGGGPWPFVDLGIPRAEVQALASYLRELRKVPPTPPKALLVVSAHWEEPVATVMTAAKPPILYDYYGFPPESYRITWPAPGDPGLAARVRELLSSAGFPTAEDPTRGYDHGTFIPLKLTWPEADVPCVQLSLKQGLEPEEHLRMGRALAPLRDEGIFILGSGLSFHNLRAMGDPRAHDVSVKFDAWLRDAATSPAAVRDAKLQAWAQAPFARQAHPREEHLLPLMVVAGAAGEDTGVTAWSGTVMRTQISGFHFG